MDEKSSVKDTSASKTSSSTILKKEMKEFGTNTDEIGPLSSLTTDVKLKLENSLEARGHIFKSRANKFIKNKFNFKVCFKTYIS